MVCSSFFHVPNFVKFCNVFANWLHIFAISLVKQQQTFAKSLHNFCKIIEICKDFANVLQLLCNILREFIAKYLQAGCKHFAKQFQLILFHGNTIFFLYFAKICILHCETVAKKCITVCKEIANLLAKLKQRFPEGNCTFIASFFANVMQKTSIFLQIYHIWSNQYHILQSFALHTVKQMQKMQKLLQKFATFLQNVCTEFARLEANLLQILCKLFANQ